MASVNRVTLLGNLGKDPELRQTPNGAAVCNISLATTRKWKDKTSGEMVEETEWHRVTFFDRQAEIAAEYLQKGSPVYVEGRLKTRKFTDKEGVEKYVTEVIAMEMQLVTKPERTAAPAPPPPPPKPKPPAAPSGFADMDDDIPF